MDAEKPSAPILGPLLVASCARANRQMQMMPHLVIKNLSNLQVTKKLQAQ
jgi:hypothetical protein